MIKFCLITTLVAVCSLFASAQIGIGKVFNANDTSRWFILDRVDEDNCIQKLIEAWGIPEYNSIGNISWINIPIPPLDINANVKLFDGISTKSSHSWEDVSFKNEADKVEKLAKLGSNQSRITEIRFQDHNGKNIVNSDELENLIKTYLISLIN